MRRFLLLLAGLGMLVVVATFTVPPRHVSASRTPMVAVERGHTDMPRLISGNATRRS